MFHVVNSDLLTTTEQLIAPANPSIWFTTNRFRQNNATSNLAGFKIAQDEEGFVAGIAAGLATKSFVVGVVLPTPWGSLRIIGQSFMKGARYACPSCTIYITYCVDWNDPNQGAAAAQKLISLGADVISGVGGGSSEGALYYAASVGVWVFCMEVDQSSGIFSNKSDPASNYYLGSVVISIYEPIYSAFELSILGKYSYQNRYLGVASGSIKRLRPNSTIAATLLNTTVKFYDTVASTNFGAIILVDTVDNIIDQLIVRLGLGVTQTKLRASYYDGVKSFGNGTWSTLDYVKISPPPIAGHSQTSLLNNQFIVFGGQLYSGSYSNVAWSYNYLNLEWNVITPNVSAGSVIPPSLSNHAAVWQNSTSLLWLFGGKRSAQSVSSDIYTLNSKLSIWKKIDIIGTSPTPRYLTASAILNEKLFVYGGIDGSNTVLKDFWSFSLNTLTWTQLLSMGPDALSGASLTAVNGTELILFGHNSFDRSSPTPRLWRYSTVSNTWTLISPDGTAPTSFTSGSAVLLDHRRILYLGGLASTSGVPQSQSFIYNSGINSWTNFTALNLPTESYAHTAVTWNATAENVYQVYKINVGMGILLSKSHLC